MNYKSIFKENAKIISPVYTDSKTLEKIVNYFLEEEKGNSSVRKGLEELLSYIEALKTPSKQGTPEFKLFKHVMETQSIDNLESYARDYIVSANSPESKIMPLVRMITDVFTYLISEPFDKKTGLPLGMDSMKGIEIQESKNKNKNKRY